MKASSELGERLGVLVREHVERQLAPLRAKLAELEARSAAMMAFKGTFQAAQRFERGDLAICDGQLFYSLRDHDAGERKPGDAGSSGWTLIARTR
jgi:hypothetical protein